MENRKPNWLINEKSLYLQQHAYNLVEWYPWCNEAFEKAKKEKKPIFLSIGYSTCHWCHVMAHEAFNDEEVAKYLNDNFVSIKVDKEERPDLDDIYMQVCQILSPSCGWPLNIMMTPDQQPFWAGSYFSVKQAYGRPPFIKILKEIDKVWRKNPNRISEIIDNVTEQIGLIQKSMDKEHLGKNILIKAYNLLEESFDPIFGGFEEPPKFPSSNKLSFLIGYYINTGEKKALEMVEKTLQSIYQGGIFDHIGGGIHRYATDNQWKTPHFEKMLYDQALMANTYIEAYQVTNNELYADIAKQILDFTLEELCNNRGGFYSGLDADSENKEGEFYLWSKDEIYDILGNEAELFCRFYRITGKGNFKNNKNIIYMSKSYFDFAKKNDLDYEKTKKQLQSNIKKLYAERKKRIPPQRDNKIITGWNGMMIKAFSLASKVFNEQKYKIAATKICIFILNKLTTPEGNLLRSYCDGEATVSGFLEDYAFFIYGLLELYEATFEVVYLRLSLNLADKMIEDFYDEENGGFYFTSNQNEKGFFRRKIAFDNSIPSANAVAVLVLQKLADISQNQRYEKIVEDTFKEFSGSLSNYPEANAQFLIALIYHLGRHRILLISESPEDNSNSKIIQSINKKLLQDGFILYKEKNNTEIEQIYKLAGNKKQIEDKTEVFICDKDACRAPLKGIEEIESYIQED